MLAADALLADVGIDLPKTPAAALRSLSWNRLRLSLRGFAFEERHVSEVAPSAVAQMDVLWSATSALAVVDHLRAADLHARFMLLALKSGEPIRAAKALALEAVLVRAESPPGGGVGPQCVARAREIGERMGDAHVIGLSYLAEGMRACSEGRLAEALEACDRAQRTFREQCIGVTWERNQAAYFGLFSLLHAGRYRELARRTHALLRDARERCDLWAIASYELTAGYHLALVEGDPEGARAAVDRAMQAWSPPDFHIQHFLELAARCAIAAYEGTAESARGAWAFLEARWPALERSQLLRADLVRWVCLWARARTAVLLATFEPERRARWLKLARADAKRLLRARSPMGICWGEATLSAVASLAGDGAQAARRLQRAIALMEPCGAVHHVAALQLRLAEVTHDDALLQRSRQALQDEGVREVLAMVRASVPVHGSAL
jgi:hypothetical protein